MWVSLLVAQYLSGNNALLVLLLLIMPWSHSVTLKPPLNNAYNECANGKSLFIAGHVQGHVLKITTESTALETGEPLNLQVLNPKPAEYT